MALSPGDRLGPYDIAGPLGAGGMGEVYRARDTTLNRNVALKILPDAFASDPDRMARFTREAQTLAALNHPHIAQIYGIHDGQHNGARVRALVMELVEGEDLSARLSRGALPLDEALATAKQIAEALEAAHEQGIVHRDLKPANVKVRPDGTVKVLDFGLAKAMDPSSGSSVNAISMSPTLTSPALTTGVGMLLGTAAYMSPEQAKGRVADKRSDIWAFGCVLFETLTGRTLFTGETVTEVLASVMKDAPALDALPAITPAAIRQLLTRCLDRDPKQRLRDIGEARIVISDALARVGEPPAPPIDTTTRRRSPRRNAWLPWAVAATALVAAGIVTLQWAPWRTTEPQPPVPLSVELGADVSLVNNFGAGAVLSPAGDMLAFVGEADGERRLYFRRLGSLQATAVAGTSGARDPFFSPDGQWVAFFAGVKLKKVSITGGAPIDIADAPNARGGAWGDDDRIVFQPYNAASLDVGSLMHVLSSGGTAERLIPLEKGEVTQRWPQVLPGGAVLFTSHTSTTGGYEGASIVVQPLPTGDRKVLVRGGYYARYLPTGHLVYVHEGTLFAAPFDVERLALTGAAAPVLDGVSTNAGFGGAQYSVAANGAIVYEAGEIRTRGGPTPLILFDRAGKQTVLRSTDEWFDVEYSPDATRIAATIVRDAGINVFVLDPARDIASRLTSGEAESPAWTPDSSRIAYVSGRTGGDIYWQRADGSDSPQRLTNRTSQKTDLSFHPSGKWLAFSERSNQTKTLRDVVVMPLDGSEKEGWKPGEPKAFQAMPVGERFPAFSPNGRWIAYSSNETDQTEVYVRPFPGPGGKWQISTGGGDNPTWSRTRPEILYTVPAAGGNFQIMSAPYTEKGETFVAERARPWTTALVGDPNWTLHPDGNRIAAAPPSTPSPSSAQNSPKRDKVVLVLNFFDELRRVAPN